jgi:predicted esterase
LTAARDDRAVYSWLPIAVSGKNRRLQRRHFERIGEWRAMKVTARRGPCCCENRFSGDGFTLTMSIQLVHTFEPATDATAPTLLLLHGTGGSDRDLLPLGRSLSPGSALLSPRGPVSEAGAARFFARLAEGVFDPAEITRRTDELAAFIAAAAKKYSIDLSRLIAIGFSNGANAANALMLLHPELLGSAILIRPMVVFDQPAAPNSLKGKPILVLNGSLDPIVPADHPPRLAALLRAGGAEVDLHVHPASHGLAREDIATAQSWLAAHRTQVGA